MPSCPDTDKNRRRYTDPFLVGPERARRPCRCGAARSLEGPRGMDRTNPRTRRNGNPSDQPKLEAELKGLPGSATGDGPRAGEGPSRDNVSRNNMRAENARSNTVGNA